MQSPEQQLRVYSRRMKVAELTLQGFSQFEITQKLGMEPSQQSTISRDVKAIKTDWRQSALVNYDEAKGIELAKYHAIEKAAWAAWERSQTERTINRARRRHKATGLDGEETELRKEKRDGNPRFLALALMCVDRRCELLGLVKKSKDGIAAAPVVGFRIMSRPDPKAVNDSSSDTAARVPG